MDHAQIARRLMETHDKGALSTITSEPAGYPFGSVMPYVLDESGNPVFLASDLAEHTINLKDDARASLMVSEALSHSSDADPLAVARVTVLGKVVQGGQEHRDSYLAKHPYAAMYVDFKDFNFYKLEVDSIRYVGGFGQMSWVDHGEYGSVESDEARPSTIAEASSDIIEHMNNDHSDALIDLAVGLGGQRFASSATMVSVDPEGFVIKVATPEGAQDLRLDFVNTAADAEQVRVEIIRLLKAARSRSSR